MVCKIIIKITYVNALRAAELVHKNNLDISAKEKLWLINTEEEYQNKIKLSQSLNKNDILNYQNHII